MIGKENQNNLTTSGRLVVFLCRGVIWRADHETDAALGCLVLPTCVSFPFAVPFSLWGDLWRWP